LHPDSFVNHDIMDRNEDLDKSKEFEYELLSSGAGKELRKGIMRNLKSKLRHLIFDEESDYRNELLRMHHKQFDILVRAILDVMRALETPGQQVILQASYDADSTFLNFAGRAASSLLRHCSFQACLETPEFSFSDFLKEFEKKLIDEVISRKNSIVVTVTLPSKIGQEGIQVLQLLEALTKGARWVNLLNHNDMRKKLDQVRLKDLLPEHELEILSEEQIQYYLMCELKKKVKVLLIQRGQGELNGG